MTIQVPNNNDRPTEPKASPMDSDAGVVIPLPYRDVAADEAIVHALRHELELDQQPAAEREGRAA